MKKHIVCLGDSNTHGYCADPADCADGGCRFNENERWPRVLEKLLGEEYLVLEEGLSGRTTVFQDPLHECMDALSVAYPILMSHEPVDLLIVMLGTNDVKERFALEAEDIAQGMYRLLKKAESLPAWANGRPRILLMAPPVIRADCNEDYHRKSRELGPLYEKMAAENGWAYLNAGTVGHFNEIDHMHLTEESHRALAARVAELVLALLDDGRRDLA